MGAGFMKDTNETGMVDILGVFENWRLKKKSESIFKLTHSRTALDYPSIVHHENGGILAIDMKILKLEKGTVNRISSAAKIRKITFYDEIPAELPEPMLDRDVEFPIRSSLKAETCPSCKGRKENKICPSCRGKPQGVTCYHCKGVGKVSAPMSVWHHDPERNLGWEGKQKRPLDRNCPKCGGSGGKPCKECRGTGLYHCKNCDGEGRIFTYKSSFHRYRVHAVSKQITAGNSLIKTIFHKYRVHTVSKQITMDNALTKSPNDRLGAPAKGPNLDSPLHFVSGKMIQSEKENLRKKSKYKNTDYSTVSFEWPSLPEDFQITADIHSSDLSPHFARTLTEFHDIHDQIQSSNMYIVRTSYSAEFTPISHLIFSEVGKSDRRYHFTLIGLSDKHTILPPKIPSSVSLANVRWLSFFIDIYGSLMIFFMIYGGIFPSSRDILTIVSVFAALIVISTLITLSPALHRIPSVLGSDSSKPVPASKEHLILLTGSDCWERRIFFCLLNFELCRRRSIATPDPWIHRMLEIFLDTENPKYGESLFCNWEIQSVISPESKETSPVHYKKASKKKDHQAINNRFIHVVDANPSIFHENHTFSGKPVLGQINAVIFFVLNSRKDSANEEQFKNIIDDISDRIGAITWIRKCIPSDVPLFIVFDGFTRKNASKISNALNNRGIHPIWRIFDVKAARTQHLEGQFEKYEEFINTFWDFVNAGVKDGPIY